MENSLLAFTFFPGFVCVQALDLPIQRVYYNNRVHRRVFFAFFILLSEVSYAFLYDGLSLIENSFFDSFGLGKSGI